jgi:DNA-binding GntR family transcriptional regulator
MTIIEAAGNPKLSKLAGDSHIHSRIFGVERFGHDKGLLEEADQIHRSIYQALKQRDGTKASQLLGVHISRSLDLTLAHIKKNAWWGNHSSQAMAM